MQRHPPHSSLVTLTFSIKSIKQGEETRRRKAIGPPPKPISRQYKSIAEANDGQRVGHADDDSSIIAQPSKTPSCGACRTRESKTWWKAPKGLPTNILCDTCGSNWRKYADLNVRPLREESLPLTKVREKREGTPLAGPSTKRARVRFNDLLLYHF
jgi:hypothetical protein